MKESMNQALSQAISLIKEAENIVAFSGAGISTEAGIPDFRSNGGLWEDQELMELMSARGFRRDPAGFYRASLQIMPNIHKAQPTSAHLLLARLEAEGKLDSVITQNIDGLHQAAGSKTVHEIHGNFRTGHCLNCHAGYEMVEFYEQMESGNLKYPRCTDCGAPIKPDVVLFGDMLPFDVWENAVEAAGRADLMIVLGSSLVVYPAAELPNTAISSGAGLIIVNREPTDFDAKADVIFRGELKDFAGAALDAL